MPRRGRPVQGPELVKDGSEQAQQRLKVVLATLGRSMTIEQACSALGIGRSAFHKLRSQFLARAPDLLEPRPRGRRRRVPSEADRRLAQLQQEIVQLKLDLKAQQVREEIALVMPHLLKDKRAGARKKTPRPGMQDGSARSRRS
jgi:hypothetical protein